MAVDPSASQIAVARLVNPLGNTAWPQTTHLTIRRPVERVARGQAFQIEVVDAQGARLPPEVRIHYRFDGPDAAAVEETEPMRRVDGAMTARRENVVRPFSYRVEGGDDQSMPWRNVEVVEPPAVESVVRAVDPAGLHGLAADVGPAAHSRAGGHARRRSPARLPGRSARRRSVSKVARRFPPNSSDDGRAFTADFTVEKSGSYWFELTDRDGLVGGSDDRWEIHAIPDAPPTVSIEQPAANLFVTPQAILPIRVAAKDDLAVAKIVLAFRRGESDTDQTTSLWSSGTHPATRTNDRETLHVDYRWDLGPLRLKPGEQIVFHAAATDYRPQTANSEPRSLKIISPAELQNRMADREKLILAELERALKIQRGCRAQVESLRARLAEPRHVGQAEVDQLQAIGHDQREADQVLTSAEEGIPMHVHALLADLDNNRLPSDDVRRRMSELLGEIEQIGRDHLPVIDRELTAAAKTAQVALDEQDRAERSDRPVAASLASAEKHQDAVIALLEKLAGRLARWDSYRNFSREIGQLLRDQEDAARRTSDVGRRTLTQELRDLSPLDLAELKQLGGRQLELARLLDRILQEMDQAGNRLRRNDPSSAQTVANAVQQARRRAISGQMRAVGTQIDANRIGRAAAGQKLIARDLQGILDILTARSRQASMGQTQSTQARTSSRRDATANRRLRGQKPGPAVGCNRYFAAGRRRQDA